MKKGTSERTTFSVFLKDGKTVTISAETVQQFHGVDGKIVRLIFYRTPAGGEERELCAGFRAEEIVGWMEE